MQTTWSSVNAPGCVSVACSGEGTQWAPSTESGEDPSSDTTHSAEGSGEGDCSAVIDESGVCKISHSMWDHIHYSL